jgi:Holliday junction DNA helicase RuvA
MIAFLNGLIHSKSDSSCFVDVQGVGYEVVLPASEWDRLPPLGQPVTLYTWYLGREDGVQLFGFLSWESRQLFKLLLGVNGVGPKAALAVLSGLSKPDLEQAVARQDVQAFSRLPGIGRKTAERLLLELKDKLKISDLIPSSDTGGLHTDQAQALEGLLALGYSVQQARTALQKVAEQDIAAPAGSDRVAHLIRQALKHI